MDSDLLTERDEDRVKDEPKDTQLKDRVSKPQQYNERHQTRSQKGRHVQQDKGQNRRHNRYIYTWII